MNKFNLDNFKKIMAAIRANRSGWCQQLWHATYVPVGEVITASMVTVVGEDGTNRRFRDPAHGECGTAHCVAGWAQILAGKEQSEVHVRADAAEFLGMPSHVDMPWLYRASRTWEDLEAVEREEIDPVSGMALEREAPR